MVMREMEGEGLCVCGAKRYLYLYGVWEKWQTDKDQASKQQKSYGTREKLHGMAFLGGVYLYPNLILWYKMQYN
jgi:hypothetical protein